MNKFNNGTLLVVIATIITAVFIFMTDRVAPIAPKDAHKTTIVENALVEVADKAEAEPAATETDSKSSIKLEEESDTQESMITLGKTEEVIAPNGPFAASEGQPAAGEELVESDTSKELGAKTSSETKKEMPDVVFVNPSTFVATSEQHEVLDHIVQPIWMDQKLGDFKSVEENEVVFKIMPTSADGLQGDNPEGVVTSKSDRFSSTSVPQNYNYQRMPMYNGGYYIAPMPSYLMPSMLPGKATIKSHEKDKTDN